MGTQDHQNGRINRYTEEKVLEGITVTELDNAVSPSQIFLTEIFVSWLV